MTAPANGQATFGVAADASEAASKNVSGQYVTVTAKILVAELAGVENTTDGQTGGHGTLAINVDGTPAYESALSDDMVGRQSLEITTNPVLARSVNPWVDVIQRGGDRPVSLAFTDIILTAKHTKDDKNTSSNPSQTGSGPTSSAESTLVPLPLLSLAVNLAVCLFLSRWLPSMFGI